MTIIYGTMSSKGGAGKTTLATLVAGEYAIADKKVLLVDADPGQNLQAWWMLSGEKGNQPENIDFISALQTGTLDDVIRRGRSNYDVIIIDTAGRDSIILSSLLNYVDVVITPVQPAKREIDAMALAAETIADFNDESSRKVAHLIVRTRISITNRSSENYRFIRPFVAKLQEAGMDSTLLDAELFERNVYREIANGYGTVQMQELTDPVKKARLEVIQLLKEIESHLPSGEREAA